MGQTVQVRNLIIGEGMPKICVPLVGKTEEEILQAARSAAAEVPDLLEWRADWYEKCCEPQAVEELLVKLRQEIGTLPLLFTFRTKQEGGETAISTEDYIGLNCRAMGTGMIDLVDVELYQGEAAAEAIISEAHIRNVAVIMSNHDFAQTPEQAEIVARLRRMQELGADISKIAVMPQEHSDVLTLLNATDEMRRKYRDTPVITMSMGTMGAISRLGGETFGSAVTFAAVGKVSAPGQIEITDLRRMLAILHRDR